MNDTFNAWTEYTRDYPRGMILIEAIASARIKRRGSGLGNNN
jgi:hypothetical protein